MRTASTLAPARRMASSANSEVGGDQPGPRVHVVDQDRAQPNDRVRQQCQQEKNGQQRRYWRAEPCGGLIWSDVASDSIEATK